MQAASPRYYVYSAIDSTIVYQGPNSAIARSTAIAQSTVGINRTILRNAKVFSYNGQLFLKNLPEDIRTLTILTINGQVVLEKAMQINQENIDVSEFKRGTYILKFTSPKGIESKKLIF